MAFRRADGGGQRATMRVDPLSRCLPQTALDQGHVAAVRLGSRPSVTPALQSCLAGVGGRVTVHGLDRIPSAGSGQARISAGSLDPLPPERLRSGGIEDERVSEDATVALSSTPMSWIGQPVKRVEDARLLSGRGAFIDDHPPVANIHHAAIVRSPYPHARILGYDVSAALAMDGVVGVVTGEDVIRHTRPFAVGVPAPVRYYCTATDKARFVGEPVALVVARNRYLAEDAAEAVVVRYEPLPAVVDVERALEPGCARPSRGGRLEPGRAAPARLRRSRPRLRRGGGRHPRALSLSQVQLDAHRDLWRDRPLGSARGRLHALVELHGAVHHAPDHRAGAGRAGEQAAPHRAARHRRQLRHQVEPLPLHDADRAGRSAHRRAGEVDRGPARAPDGVLERHRPRRLPRAGGAKGRHRARHALPLARQCRRVPPQPGARLQLPPERELRRPVPLPAPRGRRLRGHDQQEPDRTQSRLCLRPPLLRDRGHDGPAGRARFISIRWRCGGGI